MSDTQDSPKLKDLTPEEASRIIHSHRKVRYGTACWPCRQRKVKCDNQSPCENCVKREHPQLCSYKPNKSGSHSMVTATGDKASLEFRHGKKRTLSPDDQDENENRRSRSHEARETLRTFGTSEMFKPEANDTSRYLGQNSIPALLAQDTPQEMRGGGPFPSGGADRTFQDMRSIWGLDNSAPFPLMSARHLGQLTQDISKELPSDREVMKLFRSYKEIPQPFWGFVVDIGDLESKLMVYLEERAKNHAQGSGSGSSSSGVGAGAGAGAGAAAKCRRPVSASWLAVLFGVLAIGSQYHDSPYHIRTRDSQRYIQISYHFLCVGNFLLRPNFDSIQAMLMVSFCLLNDMKAEASWALLGLTCRLAQSLGLHLQSTVERGDHGTDRREMVKRKLWWTCIWHDTLTSLSFDRSPMTDIPCNGIPMSPTAETDGWTYIEAMYHLCEIICRKLNPDAVARTNYGKILENCRDVEYIREKLAPFLRNKEVCRSAVDRLQYFAIRLHTSFVISVCCRPALHRGDEGKASTGSNERPSTASSNLTPEEKKFLSKKCKENLTETVRMFLSMHQLSVIPTRSWAFTYHGLSSAVLLGILGETKADPEVHQLQGDLIAALSATAAKEEQNKSSPHSHIPKTDRDIELSGPLSRALAALRHIYESHGSSVGPRVGLKVEGGQGARGGSGSGSSGFGSGSGKGGSTGRSLPGSGTRTPLQIGQLAGIMPIHTDATTLGALRPPAPSGNASGPELPTARTTALDPHQNAALAMAQMQQSGPAVSMPDFTGLPYNAPLQQDTSLVPGMTAVLDPSQNMSPMDLYDSIFWEVPNPFNTGLDSMNFDFVAQPPPGQNEQQFYY